MKNKNKITLGVIGGLVLALGSGYFLVSNSDKDDTPVTAIYLDSNNQPYGNDVEESKKTDPNSVGHIKGSFNNEDSQITENFTLNRLSFHEVTIEIPSFFQVFSTVEGDNMLSLKNKKSDIGIKWNL
ncbi:hypothetical protein [uncultured Clostridium sp.]|uniref:hypothetical protein n=1 Tax=uncultured Clostridium sp. TaxID=59620 RepID=UPI0026115745|nr:hypothetical protein [uncultured Clostridium sp.]